MIRFLHILFAKCCLKSTGRPFVGTRQTLLVAAALWSLVFSSNSEGQLIETFDRPGEFFTLWQDDCKAVVRRPTPRTPGVETLDAHFGTGTHVHLIYPIKPCVVVDDLSASLQILCAHDGLRIAFRVVYPRSAHPATNNPLHSLVYGSPTTLSGRWSTSTVRQIVRELEGHQRTLRAQYGPNIDLSQPYVDAVVLDIYRFPGTTRVQIDDLRVEGILPYASEVAELELRGSPTILSVSDRLQMMQANVPRWIMYHGEGLDYLQALGFNGVVARRADDSLLREQAASTGLAVIAPPPGTVPTEEMAEQFSHVHAWMLGWELNESNLGNTRDQVAQLTRFPVSLGRPTIGEAMERYGSYSRLTDWVAVPTPHATRVRSLDETDQILRSESRSLAGRSVPLTSMVTQMSQEWMEQKAIAQNLVGGDSVGLPDYDYMQSRMAVYRAMMQGTRGWIFRSSGPLDRGDPTTMARARGYRAINNEIDLFTPWIQSNQYAWQSVTTNSSQHRAAVLTAPNSQLVILVSNGPMDQICAVAPETERIQLAIPTSGQVRHVFRITHGELVTLRSEQRSDALYVTVDNPGLIEQIVTVVDPKPMEYLRTQLARRAPALMDARIDCAQQVIQLAQMAFTSQRLPADHPHWQRISQAQTLFREALHARARSNTTVALQKSDEATLLAQRVLRSSWEDAVAQFTTFQSSPLVASPLALPMHWELLRLLRRDRVWQNLSIPGLPGPTWGALEQVGWRADRRLEDLIVTHVDVDPSAGTGDTSLILAAAPATNQPVPTGYAGAAMRIATPMIEAPIGSMVHIYGQVQIASPSDEPQSGLLISDSLGGDSLGQLISASDASSESWRQFGLFRFVNNRAGFQIYLETRGAMQAQIRGLRIEMIVPAPPPDIPVRRMEANEVPELPVE